MRYIDHDLIAHEEFVGMYEASVTTGEHLAEVAVDGGLEVTEELECVSKSLQSRTQTVDACLLLSLASKRAYS